MSGSFSIPQIAIIAVWPNRDDFLEIMLRCSAQAVTIGIPVNEFAGFVAEVLRGDKQILGVKMI